MKGTRTINFYNDIQIDLHVMRLNSGLNANLYPSWSQQKPTSFTPWLSLSFSKFPRDSNENPLEVLLRAQAQKKALLLPLFESSHKKSSLCAAFCRALWDSHWQSAEYTQIVEPNGKEVKSIFPLFLLHFFLPFPVWELSRLWCGSKQVFLHPPQLREREK